MKKYIKRILFLLFLLVNIINNIYGLKTSSTSVSGIWSSIDTWFNDDGSPAGRVPNFSDDVTITKGFSIYIDTKAPCVANSISLSDFSQIIFSPDGITGSYLTVNADITGARGANIIMDSSNENDKFYLDVGGNIDFKQNNTFSIISDRKNTEVNINVTDILLDKNEFGSSSFSANLSTFSNITIYTRDISIGDSCNFGIELNSPDANFNLTSYRKIITKSLTETGVKYLGTFSFTVNSGSGTLNLTDIDNDGKFEVRNYSVSHSVLVYVNKVLNYSILKFIGADPNPGNSNKPDPQTTQRNIRIIGQYNNSYIITVKLSAEIPISVSLENVSVERVGVWDWIIPGLGYEAYGIVFIGKSAPILGSFDTVRIYNCDISSSADTGLYFKNCKKLNMWWYDQGISSNVIRNCSRAGIWFDNVEKSDIRNNKIYDNIGGNIGYGIYFTASYQNTILNNNIQGNKIIGIYLSGSDKNLIDTNLVHDNYIFLGGGLKSGQEGIYLYNSDKNTIINNECYNNPVHGIALETGSNYNYVGKNRCYNNANGGIRVRYGSDGNIFLTNVSTGNGRTGFTSHNTINTLCADETFSNNGWGDIYIEGEENIGYISQIWLKNCLLDSTTEFTNTPEKQEFTKENSWVISQRHDRTAGLTRIWGQFSFPQTAHSWHQPQLKWNYLDKLYEGKSHGWNKTLSDYDTPMLRYDDGGVDGYGGTNDITSITTSSTTKTEVWIVTYYSNLNRWQVRGTLSGIQNNWLIPDTDYTSDNGEVRFRLTHHTSPVSPGEQYIFVTIAESKDNNEQKKVNLCDFSDPNYIGASFTNNTGGTVEIIGISTAPTIVTRKLAEDKTYTVVGDTYAFYYGMTLGGTVNKIEYTHFSYINSNGLTFNIAPINNTKNIRIENLQPNTTATYITANNIIHTFDEIYIETSSVKGTYNVVANNGSILTFRDYTRPFLPDKIDTNSMVYWDPTLEWSGLEGFETDGVQPNYAERLSSREFQIKYYDRGLNINGDAPTTIQVWIDLNDDLIYETTERFNLVPRPSAGNDGNYTNGEVYFFLDPKLKIDYAGDGFLKYRFYATHSPDTKSITVSTCTKEIYGITYTTGEFIYEATGPGAQDNIFSIKGTPPSATIDTPTTEQSGYVQIVYHLIDNDKRKAPENYCNVKFEYSLDGTNWTVATKGVGSEDLENLEASSLPGTTHYFVWDTLVDLPEKDVNVKIRITPSDNDGTGTPVESQAFVVDNIVISKLVFKTSSGDIPFKTTSQIVIIEGQSSAGNKDIDASFILSLMSTSNDCSFVDSLQDVKITTVSMQFGEAKFRYCDNNIGTPVITVSEIPSSGIQDAVQTWIINSGGVSITRSSITINGPLSYVVGSTVSIIITLVDSFYSPVGGKAVEISVSGTNNIINQPLFPTTNNTGQTIGYISSTKAETKVIYATDITDSKTLISTQTVTFIPDIVDTKISSMTVSPSGTVNIGSTITITVGLMDKYLNPVSNKNVSISINPLKNADFFIGSSTKTTDSAGQAIIYFVGNTPDDTKTIKATVVDDNITLSSSYTVTFISLQQPGTGQQYLDPETVFKNSIFVYPNPSKSGIVTFNYTLLNSAKVTLQVYNILGELVWEKIIENDSAGNNKNYPWLCINSNNIKVASGVYIYRIIVEEENRKYTASKKLIIIQ